MGIAIGIVVVLVLAVVALLAMARQRSTTGTPQPRDAVETRPPTASRRRRRSRGSTSRSTSRARTRVPVPTRPAAPSSPARRRPVEGSVTSPPRGEGRGLRAGRRRGARRHPPPVLQPVDPRRHRPRARCVRRRVARVPLAVGAAAASAARSPSAPIADVETAFDNKIPFYNAGAKTYIVAYPKDDLPKAKKVPLRPGASSRAWRRASSRLPEVRAPRAAGCRGARARSGSSARATARSTTGSARSTVAPRRVASTASRSRSRAATSPSTPASSWSARRSAPTPPGRAPRGRPVS